MRRPLLIMVPVLAVGGVFGVVWATTGTAVDEKPLEPIVVQAPERSGTEPPRQPAEPPPAPPPAPSSVQTQQRAPVPPADPGGVPAPPPALKKDGGYGTGPAPGWDDDDDDDQYEDDYDDDRYDDDVDDVDDVDDDD